jgi:hypothetical protein
MLDGKVTYDTNEDVENIHVFNLSTSKGTLTDQAGRFKMPVSIGDTLTTSSIQFVNRKIVVSFEHFVSKTIVIELQELTNQLDEIFLKNHSLTGNLERDAGSITTQPVVSAVSLGIIDKEIRVLTQSERQLKTAQSGFLDPLINTISRRTNMLKMRVELDKKNQQIESVLEKFPENYIIEQLGIDPEKVYDFLYYCETHPDFSDIAKKDAISILHFLKQQAKNFVEIENEE